MKLLDFFRNYTSYISRRTFLGWSASAVAALWTHRVFGETVNNKTTTLILGGGFGGIATARHLRSLLPPEHRIVLISKTKSFQIGATKTWVMLGETEPAKVTRDINVLGKHGIEVINSEITDISPKELTVTTANGELEADFIVMALGAELNMGLVPGLPGAAETFYTREGAVRLRGVLQNFKGGKIVLLIPKLPFQCPPAPYEGAMLLHSYFQGRGLGDKTSIDIYTTEKAPMSTAGPAIGKYVVERLTERSIGFQTQQQVASVDGSTKAVVLADGTRIPYDLLIAIPPHTSTKVAKESGLVNEGGWVPVEPQTLEIKNSPSPNRVYAIGDMTSVPLPGRFMPDMPLVLPKAGVFAEQQGIVVAEQIAAHIMDRKTEAVFDGKGFCYIEIGGGKALRGDGSFFESPNPTMIPREPDAAQLAEKKVWVKEWMEKYL
jgi:sulfide:quinone oxidoreductase